MSFFCNEPKIIYCKFQIHSVWRCLKGNMEVENSFFLCSISYIKIFCIALFCFLHLLWEPRDTFWVKLMKWQEKRKGFFYLLFGCPTVSLGKLLREQPNFNHCIFTIRSKGYLEPHNDIGSLSPVKHLMGFDPRIPWFDFNALNHYTLFTSFVVICCSLYFQKKTQ